MRGDALRVREEARVGGAQLAIAQGRVLRTSAQWAQDADLGRPRTTPSFAKNGRRVEQVANATVDAQEYFCAWALETSTVDGYPRAKILFHLPPRCGSILGKLLISRKGVA
jgi:hypothetical protein